MNRGRRVLVVALSVLVLSVPACSDDAASPSASTGDGVSVDSGSAQREDDARDVDATDDTDVLAARCDLGPAPDEPDPEVAADPVEFDVEEDVAYMYGTIGSDIVHRTCDLLGGNPEVEVVEVVDVPGSSTFGNETLEAGLVLSAAGVVTVVPGDGEVESGGVDYFLGGAERIVEDGACLGVHSTGIGDDDWFVAAVDLPRDDPEHQPFLAYFRAVGVPEDFYWFTLEAASPEGIHYLTPEEMVEFDVTTGPPPTEGCPLPDEP